MINKSLLKEHQKMDSSLNLEYNNVCDLLSAKVKENNEKVFLICPGKDNDQFTYSEFKAIVDQTSKFLIQSGLKKNDKISLIFHNSPEFLILYFAGLSCGLTIVPINPDLSSREIKYIIEDSDSKHVFYNYTLESKIDSIGNNLTDVILIKTRTIKELISSTSNKINFEQNKTSLYDTAVIIYTSGTTGNPKGVLYSHRSNLIHSMGTAGGDMFDLRANDSFLLIVPMFHANSWGLSFSVPMLGGKMVLPGPYMDGKSICEIIQAESCNKTCAVPTVMTSLIDYLDANDLQIPSLIETYVGGSAVPRSMIEGFEDRYDVDVIHGWGMTELNPVGVFSRPLPFMGELNFEQRMEIRCKQGRPPFGLEIKIVDDEGNSLPHDGVAFGKLMVRGPWVVERYYKAKESALDSEGWFDTGDVSTIDKHGFMQITDRAKDIIKSGGEWISSVDIENTAVGHPEVQIAACLGVKHVKWEERPLLIAVKKEGCDPSKASILDIISSEHAKWQLPDDVVFIDEMPLTATGKIDKKPLRIKYENYLMEE